MPIWLIPIIETLGSQLLQWLLHRAEKDAKHPDPKVASEAQARIQALSIAHANLRKI